MHLRRLIVLIINARNVTGPFRSCTEKASIVGLMRSSKASLLRFDRSDQKTRIHVRTLFLPEGVGSNRQCCISLRCRKIRSWTPRGINITKLYSLSSRRMDRTAISRPTKKTWWSQTGSNRRHPACKAGALPAELWPHILLQGILVGPGRLELPTSRLSGVRSNHLSYGPSGTRPGIRKPGPASER